MIVAGLGFRASASMDSLTDAFVQATRDYNVTHIATADDKANTPAFKALSDRLNLPAIAVAPSALTKQSTPTQSAASQKARRVGSVAEAAALAAAGDGSRLLVTRTISNDRLATCALALGDET